MATNALHDTQDDHRFTLDQDCTSGATTLYVGSGEVAAIIALGRTCPMYYRFYEGGGLSEQIEITDWNSGTDTLTVARGVNGSSASAHYANGETYIDSDNVAAQHREINTWLERLGAMMSLMLGGGDGVIRNALSELEVVAQGTPGMTVQIGTGYAFVSNRPAWILTAEDTAAITAPTSNPRIDLVQINNYGVLSVKTGSEAGSPSAPSADADNMGLAEIYCSVGMASIKDTDDSTNGYITDARTFL